MNKQYRVKLKNNDGQQEWLNASAANKYLAEQQAEHDANNGDLYGKGWSALFSKEV